MDSMPRICKMLRQKLKASAVLYRVALQKQELFRQEPGKTADDRRRRDQILDAVGLQLAGASPSCSSMVAQAARTSCVK